MFFSKAIPPTLSVITENKLHLSRPSSPTDSVMSSAVPSLAPSQASKTSIFGRWQRTTPTPSIISIATSPNSTDNELFAKNFMLQAQLEELQEVSTLNRTTLQKLADELETKDLECAELRKTVRLLAAELKQTAPSTRPDAIIACNAEFEPLQEKLDFANDCRKTLTFSLREKEQEIVTRQEKIDGCIAHGDSTASVVLHMQSTVKDAQDLIADLQLTIMGKDEQLSLLQSELDSTKTSHAGLFKERCDLSHNVTAQQERLASLQNETDILATRAAAAEATVAKYKSHVSTFTLQFQSLAAMFTSSQLKYQGQIDAMYAQEQLTERQSTAKLQTKDNLIAELERRLTNAEQAKHVATKHCEEEVLDLKDQVSRLTLGLKDEEIKAKDWQQYANEQSDRVAKLKEEFKEKPAGNTGE